MGSEDNAMPMDDASFTNDIPGEVPPMEEPVSDEGMETETDMEEPMDAAAPNMEIQGEDETMNIVNQLSQKDKEAVKSYAESLLKNTENNEDEPVSDGLNSEAPVGGNMAESVIFTKGQLNQIKENIGLSDSEDFKKPLNKKSRAMHGIFYYE